MPGHIGTGIRENSLKVQTNTDTDGLNATQIAQIRARLTSMGRDAAKYSDADTDAVRRVALSGLVSVRNGRYQIHTEQHWAVLEIAPEG